MRLRHAIPCRLRLTSLAATLVAATLTAAGASAVTVSLLGVTSDAGNEGLLVGDTITLEVGLSNDSGPVYAVGISVYGYDRNVVELVSVERPTSFFNASDPAAGGDPGGFYNGAHADDYDHLPIEIQKIILAQVEPRVQLFQGVSLTPIGGDGSLDRGVDGGLTGQGTAHARVTFRVIGATPTTLSIGTDLVQDALVFGPLSIGAATGTSLSIFPALGAGRSSGSSSALGVARQLIPNPEPGPALLIGFGLAVLARVRTRT